jgi:hypothetical protein
MMFAFADVVSIPIFELNGISSGISSPHFSQLALSALTRLNVFPPMLIVFGWLGAAFGSMSPLGAAALRSA